MVAKKGFTADAYRNGKAEGEAKAEVKAEKALQFQRRSTVMLGWNSGAPLNMIINMSNLSPNETVRLIAIFDKIKAYLQSETDVDMVGLKKLSDLNNAELKALVALLKQ